MILNDKSTSSVTKPRLTPEPVIRQEQHPGPKRTPRRIKLRIKNANLQLGRSFTSLWRLGTQLLFSGICLVLGWKFLHYVNAALSTGYDPLPVRPPGVEGFLPISGLMGLVDWFYQGSLNTVHPAATVLLMIFVVISIVFRKAFCGWICPVGLVSETLARIGQLLFKRNFRLPKTVDVVLRGLKYLLLGFFGWAILTMTPAVLHEFIESPYNQISDAKMMMFFVNLSGLGAAMLGLIALLSIPIHSFWCRYLCPYGALMGLSAGLSQVKIRREKEKCIDCGICDQVCPARLPVSQKLSISNVECIGCTDCVSSCPVPQTLTFGTRRRSFQIKSVAVGIVILFLLGYSLARFTGHWQNRLTNEDVRQHIQNMNASEYGHPGR